MKKKIFFQRFPLSRFLTKTLRVNKLAMKKFPKKSIIRSRHLRIKLTRTIWVVWEAKSESWPIMYVCIYTIFKVQFFYSISYFKRRFINFWKINTCQFSDFNTFCNVFLEISVNFIIFNKQPVDFRFCK